MAFEQCNPNKLVVLCLARLIAPIVGPKGKGSTLVPQHG